MKRTIILSFVFILALIGFIDSSYLTNAHYSQVAVPCYVGIFSDCGKVLTSSYSVLFGSIPLAALGVFHYALIIIWTLRSVLKKSSVARIFLIFQSIAGFLASAYFIYLMAFVLHAYCLYCFLSAVTSFILFIVVFFGLAYERKIFFLIACGYLYRSVVKQVLFLLDPEQVHVSMVQIGESFGSLSAFRSVFSFLFRIDDPLLESTKFGIHFKSPVGLAAGFDYEARLTQILHSIGFGFQTVGTITRQPYEGNPKPRLGRLPKSKSLMVYKGFKNEGITKTIAKLSNFSFPHPVGISIGKTNSSDEMTVYEAISDVVASFTQIEQSPVKHAYYELNISCPNVFGSVSFYPEKNLSQLLSAIDALHLSRPLLVKMPIEKDDQETKKILKTIAQHSVSGVIIGNLQKDRSDPSIDRQELAKFPKGNFSGKPTWNRSNELISLCYSLYAKRFVIIGCGGIFSGKDAYEKIKRGASLVQLITGMIYEGPTLLSEINASVAELLVKDGYTNISQAVGSYHRKH